MASLPLDIAAKITPDPVAGCWVWGGSMHSEGYGRIRVGKHEERAHRVVYSILIGDPGPRLDHRCFNHACVNPEHLRPVTHKQNMEHRQGAQRNSKSGVRGVSWHKRDKRWFVRVRHNNRIFHGGSFRDLDDAAKAATELRAKLFTHDDGTVVV